VCHAWGPLTHIYLANEILSLSYLLPPAVYGVIRHFREDFIYGNIMADTMIGKKYIPHDRNSHTWDFGFKLLRLADSHSQKSFAYGYLCHLAADTVIHEILSADKTNVEHTIYELKADSLVRKRYWLQAVAIDGMVQKRNDKFLETSMRKSFLSFKTNKRILKSIVFMSLFTSMGFTSVPYWRRRAIQSPRNEVIVELRKQSLKRILDIMMHGEQSYVTSKNPSVEFKRKKRVDKLSSTTAA
jgi:hypothetical protein